MKQQILLYFLNIKVSFLTNLKSSEPLLFFGSFKFKRELLGRNGAGGKASFLLFLISRQHALVRYKECLGRVWAV